jgi:aminopeptidase
MEWSISKNIHARFTLLAGVLSLLCIIAAIVDAAETENASIRSNATISAYQNYEDPRIRKFAEQLVNYSISLKKGEKVLIRAYNYNSVPLAKAIIDVVYRIGGLPYVDMMDEQVERALLLGATAEQYELQLAWERMKNEAMNARITLHGTNNASEFSDVPAEKTNLQSKYLQGPIMNEIVLPKIKWCSLSVPSPGMAQSAGMSMEAFTDFYYKACTMDYSRLASAMETLKKLRETTDKVRIVGPDTDLTFSIKGIPAVICAGKINVPDGELFTAPVKISANGILTVNQPSTQLGVTYQDIKLEFKAGKIIKASANYSDKLNQLLDVDEGARYLGEFSFGLNPYIEKPIGAILFDEKINMSFHLAIGNSYPDANNGNHSSVHWDLISIQSPEYGGGEIWFDGKLIRKDGRFVLQELSGLNPENLK